LEAIFSSSRLTIDSSHANSPNYGKHWTLEKVAEMFAPDESTVNTIKQWLIDFGIPTDRITHTDNKGWLAFDAMTEDAEGLLQTEYHLYEHIDSGHVTPVCDRSVNFRCRAIQCVNMPKLSRSKTYSRTP
jgi:hypothetical protein